MSAGEEAAVERGAPPAGAVDAAEFQAFARGSDTLFAALRSVRGRIAATEGLSLSAARLVEPLEGRPTVTVSELARHAGVAVPTATRMLQGLEQKGMVTRQRMAGNERVVEVALTPDGADALDNQRQRLRAAQRRTFGSMTPEERKVCLTLLDKLTELVAEL